MSGVQTWILGLIAGIVGIVALLMAAKTPTGEMYTIGLIVALLVLLFEFWLIKRWYDAQDPH